MPQVLKRRKERGENWDSFKARGAHRSLFSVSVLLLCHFPIFFFVCHLSNFLHIVQIVQSCPYYPMCPICPQCSKCPNCPKLSKMPRVVQNVQIVHIVFIVSIVQCCLYYPIGPHCPMLSNCPNCSRNKIEAFDLFLRASTSCAELKLLALLHL